MNDGSERTTRMAASSEALEEMSRRAAALADERNSLTALLRGSNAGAPRASRAGRRAPVRADDGAAADLAGPGAAAELDKENEAPAWHPGALADVLLVPQEPLAPDCDAGAAAAKNAQLHVRFSSPLLTPKSNALAAANAKLRSADPDSVAARQARSMVAAMHENASLQTEHGAGTACFADLPEAWQSKVALYERQIHELTLEVRESDLPATCVSPAALFAPLETWAARTRGRKIDA